jgi:hypothetical protein
MFRTTSLVKLETDILILMLWPKVFERVFVYMGKNSNTVAGPQLSVGRIPLPDKYCHESNNDFELLTL